MMAWADFTDGRGAYQFTQDGPCRFYLSQRRFGLRRWLLQAFVGGVYRHKFCRSEDAAKSGAQEWANPAVGSAVVGG